MNLSTNRGYKKNLKPNMFRIIIHSLLFGMQSVIFTMANAIYSDIFLEVGVIEEKTIDKTPKIVGFLTGAFFLGKLISDPIWGVVRDKMGDKKSLTLITFLLFLTMIIFGFCKNMIQLCIGICFIGLASGVYVPGTAFINWIDPPNRDYLAMWIYIFAGAGALIGPFIGSLFFGFMPPPKLLTTWGTVGILMLVLTGLFLFAFKDFDDSMLIEMSNYSKMEEEEMRSIDIDDIPIEGETLVAQEINLMKNSKSMHVEGSEDDYGSRHLEKMEKSHHNFRRSLKPESQRIESGSNSNNNNKRRRVTFNIEALKEKEKEQEELRDTNLKMIKSRKNISHMTATEVFLSDSVRRNLILIGAILWGVKVIDWMLLAIWLKTSKEKGGMGFSSMETGSVSLLSFPCVSLCVLACYKITSKGLQTKWLIGTAITMLIMSLIIPISNLFYFHHETLLLSVIFFNSIKEGSYLIWISTWSQLMSKMVPSMLLGRIYSWSYFLGHVLLLITSQIYPRGLTFFIEDNWIGDNFGRFRYIVFFFLLGFPLIISVVLTYRIKVVSFQLERLTI